MALSLNDFISAEELQQVRTDINDNLSELENALLRLEDAPDDGDLVNRVFRAMHTIKGVAGMFGFTRIATLTHHVEDVYDLVRKGQLALSPELISGTLTAKDQIEALINQEGSGLEERDLLATETLFHTLLQGGQAVTASPSLPQEEKVSPLTLYWIRFRFSPDERVFNRATNPIAYLNALRQLGECRVTCQIQGMPNLAVLDPGRCYLSWDVALISQVAEGTIREEFMFIEDDLSELTIRASTEHIQHGDWRLGSILTERGDISTAVLDQVLHQQTSRQEVKPLGTLLQEAGALPKETLKSALDAQAMVRKQQQEGQQKRDDNSVIRVSSDKLDQLVNQVGELVIAQARLKQLVGGLKNEHALQNVAEEITLLTEGLRDSTMSIRLLPIETLFQKFTRLVRDLSKELGKQVRFVTEGGETELDKTVIEHLNDPLVHLLRNSVDHGLETPEERTAHGKAAEGMVRLSASHAGASVLIRIEDDGKGIDPAAILAKARERGMVRADGELSDKEIFNLIFLPGFSTKTEVTSVSGRGVGMDVVKRNIEAMRGTIQVESHVGQGSLITIKLPLTLAIIDGFLVQVGEERYVIPLSAVRECVRLTHKDEEMAKGRHIIKIRNEIVPYLRLREVFRLGGQPPAKEQVVVTEIDQTRIGLVVDLVLGQSQVVIKSLGVLFNQVPFFSGTTILGDGEVAPILDVGGLLESSSHWTT